MIDVIICSGFSGYATYENTFSTESPFLLYKNGNFGDITGLYKSFVDPKLSDAVTDIDAPPYVSYVLKQLLHNKGFSSEMVFYLDYEHERMMNIFSQSHHVVFLSTTLIPMKNEVIRSAREIKKVSPDSIIICGGIFIDYSFKIRQEVLNGNHVYDLCINDYFFFNNKNEDSMEESCIDLFIINDPDLSVSEQVIKNIKKGNKINDVIQTLPNCAYFNGKKWVFSSEFINKNPTLPEINWAIFRDDEIRFSIPISYSRGCSSRCRFCNFHSLSNRIEKEENILTKELDSINTYHKKVKFLYFCDDNICGSKQSILSIINLLSKKRYAFSWGSLFDGRFLDEFLAEKLRISRCKYVKIGMESVNDTMLTNMAKPCRIKHYMKAVNSLAKEGISIDAFFIVGFPGETQLTIQNTIDNINLFPIPQYSVCQFIFFPFVLAPLSPIYEIKMRDKFKLSGHMFDWKHETMNRKQATLLVPEIVKQIKTMNPFHGSAEKMVMSNNKNYATIDKLRGDIIRDRLHTGKENDALWKLLEQAIKSLKIVKTNNKNPLTFK